MKARGRPAAVQTRSRMSNLELIVVLALALGAGGLVKGVTGMGLPLVAIPVLAAFLGIGHAVAIMTMPILVTNAWQTWQLRDELKSLRFLTPLLAAGSIGVFIGVWVLTAVPERTLSIVLAAILILYIGLRLAKPDLHIRAAPGYALAAPAGFVAGILHGATGISAPVGVTFIHALREPRRAHVAAVSTMFLAFVIFQIPALLYAGVFDGERFVQSAFAILPAAAAMPLGTFLSSRLSQEGFDRVILALLAVIAVQLLTKGAGY
jgi:uncharacterized membrane protein YfcA